MIPNHPLTRQLAVNLPFRAERALMIHVGPLWQCLCECLISPDATLSLATVTPPPCRTFPLSGLCMVGSGNGSPLTKQ